MVVVRMNDNARSQYEIRCGDASVQGYLRISGTNIPLMVYKKRIVRMAALRCLHEDVEALLKTVSTRVYSTRFSGERKVADSTKYT